MSDLAPNTRSGRLIARVRVGRTGTSDAARRYVSSNTIDSDAGETFASLVTHDAVAMPYNDGLRNLIVDGPDGALPTEVMRYSPDSALGDPVDTILHFDGFGRANGTINDGGTTVAWLGTGKATFAQTMTAQGRWWGIYHGKLRQPSFQPTNAAPHNWPTDVSRSTMNSLTNWRTWYEWCLANGMAFVGADAEGPSLNTDPGYYWKQMLETAGTYTGTTLGVASYTGSFTNGQNRLFYVESIPRAGHWASSWIAVYDTFAARDGDSSWMQASECSHPPQVWCTQDTPANDYAHAMDLLTNRRELLVVVNYDELKNAGLNMTELRTAGLDPSTSDGWMKRAIGQRGWRARSAGVGDARW